MRLAKELLQTLEGFGRIGVVGLLAVRGARVAVVSLGLVAALATAFSMVGVGAASAADLTGRQGLGGSVGSSLMIGDWEYRTHARPRLTVDAIFRYGLRPRLVLVGFFGYGWNAYANEERWLSDPELRRQLGLVPRAQEKLVIVSPFTAGLEYRFGEDKWVPYAGAGGGIYLLQIFHERSVGKDPRPFGARYRTTNFGLYGRAGVEQFLSESVSIDYDALVHIIFSEDRERFPFPNSSDLRRFGSDFHAYGGDAQLVQIRAGVRYYWGGPEE